jgi:site-specific recombinase XerD
LNSIVKRKYNMKLQDIPRLTLLIKGFPQDIKHKASIFDEGRLKAFMLEKIGNAYWMVRQAVVIVAFFGGLRIQECIDLKLEKIQRGKDGITVIHTRVKQRRSDKMESRFLVPEEGGYASQLGGYLSRVNLSLNKFSGRVWFTGTKQDLLKSQPMGRNMVAKIPHELASRFNLPNPAEYTFHSFRRTSATSAADGGSTSEQMIEFFGWKQAAMCQEYVSTSKHAIRNMAKKLGQTDFDLSDPVVEEMTEEQEDSETGKVDELGEEEKLVDVLMEEDDELYEMAGLPAPSTQGQQPVDLQNTINSVLESVRGQSGNVKIVIVTGNNATLNF